MSVYGTHNTWSQSWDTDQLWLQPKTDDSTVQLKTPAQNWGLYNSNQLSNPDFVQEYWLWLKKKA